MNNSINLKIGRTAEKTAAATDSCHIVAHNFRIVGRVQLDKSVYYCYQNQMEVSNVNENQLAENLMYYRKKKGLSQEKVSEYLDVSRQAVTKWEANTSRPTSDNLIKLAQLFEVDVDTLLGNGDREKSSTQEEISIGKMPWVFVGISVLCILAYIIYSTLTNIFSIGVCICMFISCIPIQLFLHIYFSNAIKNDSFNGIAGFDDGIEYNICEVKKLLVQIDLHIGILSTVYIFLLCVINGVNPKTQWFNGILIVVYILNFITSIEMSNYKMTDKIYRKEEDRKRAGRRIPVTVIYTLILCVGIGITGIVFEAKGIENNTLPAMKICGLLILGIMSATIGFLFENNKIKKWNPATTNYKISKVSIISLFICVIMYGLMCVI
ncbi:helix-turn-helix domain-containing protein [Acetatifactor muris]|uniref:helix-turn-helix domain-containing protein n=1 Tax=Acetatifactor muris TaxID=879566 RepID=UPI0011AF6513|nr:helix-turn-helix transcriptional regulator [Acetatifactor muris]MCR2046123.1 helix-turn-helix domain-containing protein [Acetatifactor muris]